MQFSCYNKNIFLLAISAQVKTCIQLNLPMWSPLLTSIQLNLLMWSPLLTCIQLNLPMWSPLLSSHQFLVLLWKISYELNLLRGHLSSKTTFSLYQRLIQVLLICIYLQGVMVFNTTFNNISVISWWLVLLLVEETGIQGENHQSFL